MTRPDQLAKLRVSDADRNGTLRRLHNAVALGLIDIGEFEERSSKVSGARTHSELDGLVGDLPGAGAIVTSGGRPRRAARLGRLAQTPRRMDRADPVGAGASGGLV
jgi:hypothetical protein